MTTKLEGNVKRELSIGRQPYTLTISPVGFTLALKGNRKGLNIKWADLVTGEAALATALNASLTANIQPAEGKHPAGKSTPRKNASRATVSSNIKTLVHKYERDGKIGASHPASKKKAVKQAVSKRTK
jgi:hypothetical protein